MCKQYIDYPMRKLLLFFILLSLPILCVAIPHGKKDGIVWQYSKKTQTLYISGFGKLDNPYWAQNNKSNLQASGRYVRGNKKWEVKNVKISEGISDIGPNVLYWDINEITYNGTMEQWLKNSWGEKVFASVKSVSHIYLLGGEITIPSSLTTIPQYAFQNCQISKLVLPSSVRIIEEDAFKGSTIDTVIYERMYDGNYDIAEQFMVLGTGYTRNCSCEQYIDEDRLHFKRISKKFNFSGTIPDCLPIAIFVDRYGKYIGKIVGNHEEKVLPFIQQLDANK